MSARPMAAAGFPGKEGAAHEYSRGDLTAHQVTSGKRTKALPLPLTQMCPQALSGAVKLTATHSSLFSCLRSLGDKPGQHGLSAAPLFPHLLLGLKTGKGVLWQN